MQDQAGRAFCAHSASSCLENTSGSHDLLALKKYFHLNYTNVSVHGSPGARLSPIPSCRSWSSAWAGAGAVTQSPGERRASVPPRPGHPRCCRCPLHRLLPAPELCPALPVPCLPWCCHGSQLLSEPTNPPSCGIYCGVGGFAFSSSSVSVGGCVTASGVTLHI